MFLFPWLDWGIDISDFEKIDFLAHEPYLAFLAPWKGAFLGPQVEFRPHSGGVEYSTCPKIFIFEKYNISAFKWRVERFSTTLKEKKAACLRKKRRKKHPEKLFDWRVSTCDFESLRKFKDFKQEPSGPKGTDHSGWFFPQKIWASTT